MKKCIISNAVFAGIFPRLQPLEFVLSAGIGSSLVVAIAMVSTTILDPIYSRSATPQLALQVFACQYPVEA
jgi:hypothetical protein